MKIAISTDGNNVSPHFGRCPNFTLVDIEKNNIIIKTVIENPGHERGFIPKYLCDKNVKCVICGGMGQNAAEIFNELGIHTITGVSGNIEEVIKKFINGTLVSGESLCKPGDGKGYGIEKEECNHDNEHRHDHNHNNTF
jgi:predicted Fe-Mo cluster-binding NifX family protein